MGYWKARGLLDSWIVSSFFTSCVNDYDSSSHYRPRALPVQKRYATTSGGAAVNRPPIALPQYILRLLSEYQGQIAFNFSQLQTLGTAQKELLPANDSRTGGIITPVGTRFVEDFLPDVINKWIIFFWNIFCTELLSPFGSCFNALMDNHIVDQGIYLAVLFLLAF